MTINNLYVLECIGFMFIHMYYLDLNFTISVFLNYFSALFYFVCVCC